ncbi:MAG TPA: response regulator [Candidatus Udaeobacter sp.]|jgi:CheY-like chemotaxis protein
MKLRLVLLLTRDSNFQSLLGEGLYDGGAIILVARNINDAIQLMCSRGTEFDLVVIDFDDGSHGITLLSAIQTCRPELPIIVVTSSDAYQAAGIVFANGVQACLAKPISAAELKIVIEELAEPKSSTRGGDRPELVQIIKIQPLHAEYNT